MKKICVFMLGFALSCIAFPTVSNAYVNPQQTYDQQADDQGQDQGQDQDKINNRDDGYNISVSYNKHDKRIRFNTITNHDHVAPRPPIHWVDVDGDEMPFNAIPGGFEESRTLYICQADYAYGTHPGKVVEGHCNIGFMGREVSVNDYRVLVGRGVHWEQAFNGFVPPGAVVGGDFHDRPLYVCRANYNGGKHPGKLMRSSCNFGYAGAEVKSFKYQVLVKNGY